MQEPKPTPVEVKLERPPVRQRMLNPIGGVKPVSVQQVPMLGSIFYSADDCEKLNQELIDKGHKPIEFYLITKGENKGKYKEFLGYKKIHHRQ